MAKTHWPSSRQRARVLPFTGKARGDISKAFGEVGGRSAVCGERRMTDRKTDCSEFVSSGKTSVSCPAKGSGRKPARSAWVAARSSNSEVSPVGTWSGSAVSDFTGKKKTKSPCGGLPISEGRATGWLEWRTESPFGTTVQICQSLSPGRRRRVLFALLIKSGKL